MVFIAIAIFIGIIFNKSMFGIVGENVTLRVREILYGSILEKHLGWFDDKENSPGVISATMASDV
jgi:ATP-binding cassette subfamily B (MDR/TAP) protein 1